MGRKIKALKWAMRNKPNVKGTDYFYKIGLGKPYGWDSSKLFGLGYAIWFPLLAILYFGVGMQAGFHLLVALIISLTPCIVCLRAGLKLDNDDKRKRLDEYVRKMRVNAP